VPRADAEVVHPGGHATVRDAEAARDEYLVLFVEDEATNPMVFEQNFLSRFKVGTFATDVEAFLSDAAEVNAGPEDTVLGVTG